MNKTKNLILYDITNTTIDRYDLIPNKEKIIDYKKKEIEKEGKIYKATTNCEKKLTENLKSIYLEDLKSNEYDQFDGKYFTHTFNEYSNSEDLKKYRLKLLNNYYNGDYNNNDVVQVIKNNKFSKKDLTNIYLLLTSSYKYNANMKKYIMEDIISIPESLYLLQLLEQEKYEQIFNKDIEKQLQLYDISNEPTNRININSNEEFYNEFGEEKSFNKIINDVKVKQMILEKRK